MKLVSAVFNCLLVVNLHAISFGFKTCRTFASTTNEAVTLTIYEGNKMFQCVIPSANKAGKVYKCSDKPTENDEIAFECRSADTDKYGMLITVPPNDNSQTDDVCIDALIVNGPTEYDTRNAYIGDGFGGSYKHSRYYDFDGGKPSDSNNGPFTNAKVYEGIPTCFEECNVLPPPPPLILATGTQCTATENGPGQYDIDDCKQYCVSIGCVLVSAFCNDGALQGGEFIQNPKPCTPTCGDTVPDGGPFIQRVAAHQEVSDNIVDNNNNEELMKEFYEMKNKVGANNVNLMVYFAVIAFVISCSMICIYHKMRHGKSDKKITYESVEPDDVKINQ